LYREEIFLEEYTLANITQLTQELITPYLEENGFELVDVEFVKEGRNWFLRVFVDKAGGIDIAECGKISEILSAKLDEQDPIKEAYFLEVSSPGAERPLKKPEDVRRAVGQNVYITTYVSIDGDKEFEGELSSFDGETLVIKVRNKAHTIPYEKVASARLAVVF
jgi:ribosome maturation factor RimP